MVRHNDEGCSATQHPDFLRSRQYWVVSKIDLLLAYKGINPQDQGLELFNIKLISPTTE